MELSKYGRTEKEVDAAVQSLASITSINRVVLAASAYAAREWVGT